MFFFSLFCFLLLMHQAAPLLIDFIQTTCFFFGGQSGMKVHLSTFLNNVCVRHKHLSTYYIVVFPQTTKSLIFYQEYATLKTQLKQILVFV